ncbi:LuxR C-terminal-related transcriptional regulator [Streptomyces sp. NPDC005760]|uniref:LuxR C-terminal-related transcriptional regulator n=1 Tax=Streptomyces sp. NPDC005760 TaxID=3156718 RepID=UPI003401AF03
MIGRDAELAMLRGLLFDPTIRILTLAGPAGVGKSRLALAAAAQCDPAGLVVVVDLGDTDDDFTAWTEIAAQVTRAVGRGEGEGEGEGVSTPEELADLIECRELLLILDNCDLVASRLSLGIARLVASCSGLRVLSTSRVSLDIYDEQLFWVCPFSASVADWSSVTDPDASAVRLFVERARAQQPSYALVDDDLQVINDICAALDGLPLAIELSAGAVGMLGLRGLLNQLRQDRWPASSRLLDLPARHRTLAKALAWGDGALAPEHRGFLQQLTVCVNPFDAETARRVADLDLPTAMCHLEVLVHMSLLQRTEQATGEVTFSMLNLVRHYYSVHVPLDPDGLVKARDRHAAHFAETVALAACRLNGPDHASVLGRLRARRGDHLAAISHLQSSGRYEAAARMLIALDGAVYDLRCLAEMHERLLRSAERLEDRRGQDDDRSLRARALETAGAWSLTLGDPDGAVAALSRARCLYGELGDDAGTARVAAHSAEAARRTGDHTAAADHVTYAVTELDRLGDRRSAALARRTLALVETAAGKPHAEAHLTTALGDLRAVGGPRAVALVLMDLARVLTAGKKPVEAWAAIREAMDLLYDVGESQDVADALETAARVLPLVDECHQRRSARLLLIAQALRARHKLPEPDDSSALERLLARLDASLGYSTMTELSRQIRGVTPIAALNDALSAPLAVPSAARQVEGDTLWDLTPRQSQIARMVADGLTNRQIARALELSEWTVINHLRQVMQKLGCPSRVHVARLVQQATTP